MQHTIFNAAAFNVRDAHLKTISIGEVLLWIFALMFLFL
jgi:hypothetical protein